MKIQDTLLVVLSDMHTGGSTALFPSKGFKGTGRQGNLILQNDKQKEIHPIFTRMMGEVAKARKGKRMIVVNLGDAIDGFHHGSMQETLFNVKDQCAAHIELMQEFLQRVGFNRKGGDELYYVRGTEVHVGDTENDIGKELGAIHSYIDPATKKKQYIHEVLELNINGKINYFIHHGKGRGDGPNEGNALRNFLRNVRDNREKDGLNQIDILWSGHTHGHAWESHRKRMSNGNFHEMHGIICPSWQSKTVWALGKVPMAINSVGGTYLSIGVDGQIGVPRFVVKTTNDN